MRPVVFFFIALLAICFVSCQKKYAPDGLIIPTGGGTSDPNAPLLIRTESKTTGSSEASSQNFEYNASRRVVKVIDVVTDENNASETTVYRYVRNSSGVVTKIISNILMGGASGSDSLEVNIHYPAGSSNFDYRTFKFELSGLTFRDSVTYIYSNGVVTDSYQYQDIGMGMAPVNHLVYTYLNGNLVTQKVFSQSSGALVLAGTYTFEYDNKTNAAGFGNESLLLGLDPLYSSANNPAKATVAVTGQAAIMLNYSYQYNTGNMPVTGTVIQSSPTKTSLLKFFYQ